MNNIILSQGATSVINQLMNKDGFNEQKAMIAEAMSEATQLVTYCDAQDSILSFVLSQYNDLVNILATCQAAV